MSKLWFLLPLASMFFCFYMAKEIIPFGPEPFMFWWDIPLAITIIAFWFISLCIGIVKGSSDL